MTESLMDLHVGDVKRSLSGIEEHAQCKHLAN